MTAVFLRGKLGGDADIETLEIRTSGDKRQDWSLEKYGGKGLFTKEIEEALIAGDADLAVHSAKDLPTEMPEQLALAGCLPRDACRDVMVLRNGVSVPSLIATGSPRRRSQLKRLFPHAVWTELRGNVETRLGKIAGGDADASVLSEAGVKRLGIESYAGVSFSPLKIDVCVPAVGHGIVALECRRGYLPFFSEFFDKSAFETFALEREFLSALGGGCQVAYAANYDGEFFRFYHENTGFQKIAFPENSDFESKLATVREIAKAAK